MLAEYGADLEARDSSRHTPLHSACQEGHLDAARALLDAGASAAAGARGLTPLHLAAELGHWPLCELLVQFGADPAAGEASTGVPSPAAMARRGNHAELAALLEAWAQPQQ
ncbi:unnamed protein product [Prorocentrum cordatum]|uniref:Uncharacterized protein n=1 Tax=Prorocentrum cordatum TaxID=2364126 RepID=A0ABN9UWQ2_9DINO|nr:unnamed protein product [Polarella glacialis]